MKSYTFLLLLLLFLGYSESAAQDAMPTKEETVNYLHKKMSEVVGRVKVWENEAISPMTYRNASIALKDSNIEITVTASFFLRSPRTENVVTQKCVFNPGYISRVDIEKPKKDEGIGFVYVRFDKKLVTWTFDDDRKQQDSDVASFPYYATIPGNDERIKKALLHLRDLAKAEEDPFSK
jgi:hypothetical protein